MKRMGAVESDSVKSTRKAKNKLHKACERASFVISACARASAIRPDASRDFRAQKTVSLYFGVEGFCATMFKLVTYNISMLAYTASNYRY